MRRKSGREGVRVSGALTRALPNLSRCSGRGTETLDVTRFTPLVDTPTYHPPGT